MDKYIAEGVLNNLGNWDLRREYELVKIWIRWEGSDFN